jgi:hypothetical protein
MFNNIFFSIPGFGWKRALVAAALVCVAWAGAQAQVPTKIWDQRFGGTIGDDAHAVVAAPGGGYVVAGYSTSGADGDKSQASQGGFDYWLVKVDDNGDKVWDKRFGGTISDLAYAVVAAPGGGYVVAGFSTSGADGDKSQASRGGADYWLVKVDENGNKVWDKRFGGTSTDVAYDVVAAPGGGYVVAGYSDSDANGDKTQASQGVEDYWLVKIDENGNKVWDKRFGGTGDEYAYAIVAASDGGYVVAGYSISPAGGDKTEASQGNNDYWLVKIDENGDKVWDKRFGGTGNDLAYDVAAAPGGGYVVAGRSESGAGGDKTEASQGGTDYWLVKLQDLNQAPTDLALAPTSIAENNAVNAVVGTFTTTDPDAGNTFAYSLVSGTGDADNASFTISGNELRASISFDFEVKSSYSIRVRTTDQGGLFFEKAFTISINDVSECAGIFAVPDANFRSFLETNYPATICDGKIIPAQAALVTGTLNVSFQNISNLSGIEFFTGIADLLCFNNQLTTLDLSQNTALVQLFCYDNQLTALNLTQNTALVQLVCNNNQLTALDLSQNTALAGLSCSNNQLTALDLSQNTALVQLFCSNNQLTALNLSQNTALVQLFCSNNPQLTGFTGTLPNSLEYLSAFNTGITCLPNVPTNPNFFSDVASDGMGGYIICNDAPTDLSLSPSSIAENNAVNAVVGTFTSTDPDAGDNHIYSLVSGAGSADNAAFNIDGSNLRASAAFDFETKSSYSICVRTTDQGGLAYEEAFVVTVTDVNEGGGPAVINILSPAQPIQHPALPVSGNEGSNIQVYELQVVLTGATTYPVTVQLNSSGTATRAQAAGVNSLCSSKIVRDYSIAPSPSGGPVTLTWSSKLSPAAKLVIVRVNGDDCPEADENFTIALSNPVGATLGTSTFTHTILNDDAPRLGAESEQEALATGLTLYPNPTQGALMLAFQSITQSTETLRILDVTGRVVSTQAITTVEGRNEVALDLAAQPAGVYFIQALGQTAKVVLAK